MKTKKTNSLKRGVNKNELKFSNKSFRVAILITILVTVAILGGIFIIIVKHNQAVHNQDWEDFSKKNSTSQKDINRCLEALEDGDRISFMINDKCRTDNKKVVSILDYHLFDFDCDTMEFKDFITDDRYRYVSILHGNSYYDGLTKVDMYKCEHEKIIEDRIYQLDFSRDLQRIVFNNGERLKLAYLSDSQDLTKEFNYPEENATIIDLAFSPEGDKVAMILRKIRSSNGMSINNDSGAEKVDYLLYSLSLNDNSYKLERKETDPIMILGWADKDNIITRRNEISTANWLDYEINLDEEKIKIAYPDYWEIYEDEDSIFICPQNYCQHVKKDSNSYDSSAFWRQGDLAVKMTIISGGGKINDLDNWIEQKKFPPAYTSEKIENNGIQIQRAQSQSTWLYAGTYIYYFIDPDTLTSYEIEVRYKDVSDNIGDTILQKIIDSL